MYSRHATQTSSKAARHGLFGSSGSSALRRGGRGRQSGSSFAGRVFVFFGAVTFVGLLLSTSVLTTVADDLPSSRSTSSIATPATILGDGAQENIRVSARSDTPTGRALRSDTDSDTDYKPNEDGQSDSEGSDGRDKEGGDVGGEQVAGGKAAHYVDQLDSGRSVEDVAKEFLTKVIDDTQEDSLSDQVKRIERFKTKTVEPNDEDDGEAEDDSDELDAEINELQGKQTTPTRDNAPDGATKTEADGTSYVKLEGEWIPVKREGIQADQSGRGGKRRGGGDDKR
mmetsp:Transcript_31170/g.68095  ORF Transcript_31170/g.68095 Transcript_31170/m.68095 type:complete len:284 (+) Transcript_31170:243-1094(+)